MSLTIDKCIEGWTNSLKQLRVRADIVFFGDSMTYYGDFASVFPNKIVCNLGLRGDTIQGLMTRVNQVELLQPTSVFLMTGINDVGSYSPKGFQEDYEILIDTLRKRVPSSTIVIQNILPVNNVDYNISCNNKQITHFNNLIFSLTERKELRFLDLFSLYEEEITSKEMTIDGIHLRPEGYQKWYKVLEEFSFTK